MRTVKGLFLGVVLSSCSSFPAIFSAAVEIEQELEIVVDAVEVAEAVESIKE